MAKTFLEMPRGTPANQKENALAFAGTPANRKENALAFAGLPQIEKRTLWRLRDSRGAFSKALWPLQRSIKGILQGLGTSFFRRNTPKGSTKPSLPFTAKLYHSVAHAATLALALESSSGLSAGFEG